MIVVHTTYHLDQEAFIVPTHNETPPPQHSNTRTVCAPSQYIVNIGSPWRHRHIQSTNRAGFASSQVALVVRAKCPCSGHVLPTLNCLCPHNAIATQYTIHIVCRTWKSFTNSTRLDLTDRWRRCASTFFSLYLHHVGLLLLSWCSSRMDVLFFLFQATKRK